MKVAVFADRIIGLFRQSEVGIKNPVFFMVGQFNFHGDFSFSFSCKYPVKGIGGKLVSFFQGVNINVGGFQIAVPKAGGNGFDIAPVGEKHGCGGMP